MHVHVLDCAVHGSLLQIVGSSAFVFSILFLPPNQSPPPAPYPRAKEKNLKNKQKGEHIIYSYYTEHGMHQSFAAQLFKSEKQRSRIIVLVDLAKISFAPQNPSLVLVFFCLHMAVSALSK